MFYYHIRLFGRLPKNGDLWPKHVGEGIEVFVQHPILLRIYRVRQETYTHFNERKLYVV